jgi:deazaflavin-dependent oxidoreductase (nitroreductase family)
VRNPLTPLARVVGRQAWLLKLAPAIVWTESRLHALFKGRITLLGAAGLPSLRVTTTGRKSGLPRAVNLLYFPYRGDYVLTGSNWGRPVAPAWVFNLRAHPDATIVVRGRAIAVSAREVEDEEYDEYWRLLLAFWPGYEMERREAGRPFAIFVLRTTR